MDHIVKALNHDWSLKEVKENRKYKAEVPGSVYVTLLKNKVIKDPFYGANEKECQWVYETDWEYSTIIKLSKEIEENDYCMLRFYGLDTYCQVFLNDRVILFGDNMHRTYEVYIKTKEYSFLEEVENKLIIRFMSPVKEAQERLKQSELCIDSNTKYHLPFSIPGVEMLRKAYYSFGWDWAPKLPDSGIWRTVELHVFNESYIKGVQVQTDIDFIIGDGNGRTTAKRAEITLETELEGFNEKSDKAILYQIFDGEVLLHSEKLDSTKFGTEKKIMIKNPKLWWSHDLGKPHLYRLIVKLFDGEYLLDEYSTYFGIREIQLIRKEDRWGETFYFELNKVPIFAKGGNWVPSDSFLSRGKRNQVYKNVLDACVNANMNMIRIWGGGIYEEDEFYNHCDQLGILVWQDFAFACRPTPDYSGFEESVIKEATDNIKRLRNHPSLTIWVGNNEIEEGWKYWGFEKYVPQYKQFYLKLFEETLPKLIKKYDPTRSYWPSSPSSGGDFKDPQSSDYGDSHYWKVWHEGFPLESYRTFNSRFMSEFGFESFPVIKSIKCFCEHDQMFSKSKSMENHQKNPAGNQKIFDYMEKRFNIPQSFEKQVVLSQIAQAEAMEYGVEHWRRNRNNCHCMGTLYWQINDCWPAASWSSIDYYGRWKALHYYAKRFYNPFYINVYETSDFFEIWFCNDLPVKFSGKYEFKLMDLSGEVQYQKESGLIASGLFSTVIEKVNFADLKIDPSNSVLFFKAVDNMGYCVSEGFKLFSPPKYLNITKPTITFKITKKENNYELIISADKPVLYCLIESKEDLTFSDNYFSFSGDKKLIHFQYNGEIDVNSIRISSLYDFLSG